MTEPDPRSIGIATPEDLPRLLEVWETSVRATHGFLTEGDLQTLRPQVQAGLAAFAPLHVLRGASGEALAFLGVEGTKVEMLFVHADHRGRGAGRCLLEFALEALGAVDLDVNEQNPAALGFYQRFGFRVAGRSPVDTDGRPFPLLHLRRDSGKD